MQHTKELSGLSHGPCHYLVWPIKWKSDLPPYKDMTKIKITIIDKLLENCLVRPYYWIGNNRELFSELLITGCEILMSLPLQHNFKVLMSVEWYILYSTTLQTDCPLGEPIYDSGQWDFLFFKTYVKCVHGPLLGGSITILMSLPMYQNSKVVGSIKRYTLTKKLTC